MYRDLLGMVVINGPADANSAPRWHGGGTGLGVSHSGDPADRNRRAHAGAVWDRQVVP